MFIIYFWSFFKTSLLFIIIRQGETWVAKRKNSHRSVMSCEICVFCDNYIKLAFCDRVMWNPRCLVKPEFHWPCHVKSALFSKTWVLLVNIIWFFLENLSFNIFNKQHVKNVNHVMSSKEITKWEKRHKVQGLYKAAALQFSSRDI